jgi:hypothetical protein
MIPIPRFILQKESKASLWVGLIFFSLLMMLMLLNGILPFIPTISENQSEEIPPELKQLELPEKITKELISMRSDITSPKPEINYRQQISSLISGVVLVFWPIIPIGRELRKRHLQSGPDLDC